jgi:hypothetical protein
VATLTGGADGPAAGEEAADGAPTTADADDIGGVLSVPVPPPHETSGPQAAARRRRRPAIGKVPSGVESAEDSEGFKFGNF